MELKPLRGDALLRAAVDHILLHPETWDQGVWHWQTRHCFGGWCQILAGRPAGSSSVFSDLMQFGEVSRDDAGWLVDQDRSLLLTDAVEFVLLLGRLTVGCSYRVLLAIDSQATRRWRRLGSRPKKNRQSLGSISTRGQLLSKTLKGATDGHSMI